MIPPFDHNDVLPPYLGDNPAIGGALSPYRTDIMEFCNRFATSRERIEILKGFVQFRLDCIRFGVRYGFQWIDGSFIEDIEKSDKRAPRDIDVVTFVFQLTNVQQQVISRQFLPFVNPKASKKVYNVDHYPVVADGNPLATINMVKYWNQLFGHDRKGVWKGMVEIPLCADGQADTEALNYLNNDALSNLKTL